MGVELRRVIRRVGTCNGGGGVCFWVDIDKAEDAFEDVDTPKGSAWSSLLVELVLVDVVVGMPQLNLRFVLGG